MRLLGRHEGRLVRGMILLLAGLPLLGGCGRGGAGVAVEDAWARPARVGGNSAAYFVVHNRSGSEDALVSASAEVAGKAEVHETVALEGGEHRDMAMDRGSGAMQMRPVERVQVPAGGTVEFRPGGYHVMLMELKQDLKVGDSFRLTLNFEKSGSRTVEVKVQER